MEREIILKIKAGDHKAFKELYDRYADYAIRAATAITSNHMSAADVVQETFIRIYQNIESYDEAKPFKPWFYKILLNECNRYVKKHSRAIPTDINEEINLPGKEDVYAFEKYDDLYQAIQQLDDIHRIPLVLKYLNDFTEQEIAEVLDLNVNTVKSRLFKGRKKLKQHIIEVKEG